MASAASMPQSSSGTSATGSWKLRLPTPRNIPASVSIAWLCTSAVASSLTLSQHSAKRRRTIGLRGPRSWDAGSEAMCECSHCACALSRKSSG